MAVRLREAPRSEVELQTNLRQPLVTRAGDLAEERAGADGVHVERVRMVEHIEQLTSELEFQALVDLDDPGQGQVPSPEARPLDRAATGVTRADDAYRDFGKGVGVEPLGDGVRGAGVRIGDHIRARA